MLKSHETVKQAWSNFKSYPKLKVIILYLIIAALPSLFVNAYIGESTDPTDLALSFVASIPSMVMFYFVVMAVAHYVCSGWVFNGFKEFVNPPSSVWRLFWKSIAVYLMLSLTFIILSVGAGFAIGFASQYPYLKFFVGFILGIPLLILLIKYTVKIMVMAPYFAMNDRAPLLSSLRFSNGHWWYLSGVFGWTFLYAILFVILFVILTGSAGYIGVQLGTIGIIIFGVMILLLQSLATFIMVFVNTEAYKQIAENKS